MSDVAIEVRCKGGFAYLKGKNGARWLVIPPLLESQSHHDAHVLQLWVRKGVVDENNPLFVPENLEGAESVHGFVRFNRTVEELKIIGAAAAPPKDGATSPIPSNGLPNGPEDEDDSWASQGFIANLRRLYPPQLEPVAKLSKAVFLLKLPRHTEWHGLAPLDPDMRTCKWDFARTLDGPTVIPSQVITDVVGIPLFVPESTELHIKTDTSVEQIPVTFGTTDSPLLLIADPRDAIVTAQNKFLEHFRHLYHLTDPLREDQVVPRRLCPVGPPHAGDIFCPGGEGEGEGGG